MLKCDAQNYFDCLETRLNSVVASVTGFFVFRYYEATIEDITEDGEEVSVVFDSYKNSDVTTLPLLREIKSGVKRQSDDGVDSKAK